MKILQVDFYRRPLRDDAGEPLWELVVCDGTGHLSATALCPQSQANPNWISQQLQQIAPQLPDRIQLFRPECQSLMEAAGRNLGIPVEPTRHTATLKRLLQQRAQDYPPMREYTGEAYEPISVYRPAPIPVPEEVWGDRWRFASLPAGDIAAFGEGPLPIRSLPDFLLPLNLGLPSTLPIPGVAIEGGRQSMGLARWLQEVHPVGIQYIAGDPDGLVLEAGLVDRWVLATFEDREVAAAARIYQQRQQQSRGLHFLVVQPDDSGMTYSGFWLLQPA